MFNLVIWNSFFWGLYLLLLLVAVEFLNSSHLRFVYNPQYLHRGPEEAGKNRKYTVVMNIINMQNLLSSDITLPAMMRHRWINDNAQMN